MVAGLGEHVREHPQQFGVGMNMANPPPFVVVTQHDLSHRQADQLTVSEIGSMPPAGTGRDHMVINQHVSAVRRVFRSFVTH